MTVALEQPRFTFDEWSRIVSDPTKDNAYQRVSRLGGAVARYLAWKKREASARTLEIYELYLASLCVHVAQRYGDPTVDAVTLDMLMTGAEQHPDGSYRILRSAYRDFFRWAEDITEEVTRNPARKMPKARRQNMKVYDIFTPAEQAKIIRATDQLPLPWIQRLRALCFIDLGIRKDEARGLQPYDFDTTARTVVVRGKGDKERLIEFGDDLFRAFVSFMNRPIPNVRMKDNDGAWREARTPLEDDYLFFPYGFNRKSGAVTWADPFRPMAPRSMHSWWADYVVKNAGIRYRSMHMARHTLGTNLSDAGQGLETIQDWLGHADPSTTKVYVHNSRSRLKRARGSLDDWRRAQGG